MHRRHPTPDTPAGTPLDEGTGRAIATAEGDFRGLHLPGHGTARRSRRSRLTVVLTADELRLSGGGLQARFPVRELVLTSSGPRPPGVVRVDLVDGDHICVLLEDGDHFMELLRQVIWEFEKSLLPPGSDPGGAFDVSPTLLAEAEACMDAADARMRETGSGLERDRVARELVARSTVLHRRVRADAVRRRRRRLRDRVVA